MILNEEIPTKTKTLYNPTLDDVTTDVDKYGENPERYTLKAGDIQEFPDYVAELLKDKLLNILYWNDLPKQGRAKRLKEVQDLIEVK